MSTCMTSLGNLALRPVANRRIALGASLSPSSISRRTSAGKQLTCVVQASLSPISRKAMKEQRRQAKRDREAANTKPSAPTPSPVQQRPGTAGSAQSVSFDILEAFFYGRAFAITLSKRLSEAVVDTVAEISKQAAERPQKLQEFQDEVVQLARKEMAASSGQALPSPSSNGNGSSSRDNGARQPLGTPPVPDLQAVVDDLRAEIAYSRAILQQIKTGGKSGAVPGPPPAVTTTAPPASSNGSGSV